MRWDIFCTVIDNYGDIGIAWRLARQLSLEYGLEVGLWVDDLASFARLRPEIAPNRQTQSLDGVTIHHWTQSLPRDLQAADVVVEALACHLPEDYVDAMAARPRRPVWINLDYLSAEDWIVGCHGLPSPHPRLPLVKHFFFPGWVPGTGGVLRERELLARVAEFQADPDLSAIFWRSLGLEPPQPGTAQVSLFAYENAALPGLLEHWARQGPPTRLLVPEGRALTPLASHFGQGPLTAGARVQRGQLECRILPMLDQDRYDQLLWACDCNFVRGEDSLVRAQWAGQPLVWQAYVQEDEAHRAKIDAYLNLYTQGLEQDTARAIATLVQNWNRQSGADVAWDDFWRHREALSAHQARWNTRVAGLGDLADNLVHFCYEKL